MIIMQFGTGVISQQFAVSLIRGPIVLLTQEWFYEGVLPPGMVIRDEGR